MPHYCFFQLLPALLLEHAPYNRACPSIRINTVYHNSWERCFVNSFWKLQHQNRTQHPWEPPPRRLNHSNWLKIDEFTPKFEILTFSEKNEKQRVAKKFLKKNLQEIRYNSWLSWATKMLQISMERKFHYL